MSALIPVIFILLMCNQGTVTGLRIIDLRVPAHVSEGGEALLGCLFDMEQDTLYSLKWYKDGKEFYRYVPQADQPAKSFYVAGVIVDVNHSSSNTITLKHLARESAGVFRCEVYGEGPNFTMAHKERHVSVDLLPKDGPLILGLKNDYQIGRQVDVNCTTTPSRPEAQLKWLVNGQPAPSHYLTGPILMIPTDQPHTYQSKLNLHFPVRSIHFPHGKMTLKCQATIPPLYNREIQYTFNNRQSQTVSPPTHSQMSAIDNAATMWRISSLSLILQIFVLFILNYNFDLNLDIA